MPTKKFEEVIRAKMPGAKVVTGQGRAAKRTVQSDSATPNAAALLRKYGGIEGDAPARVTLGGAMPGRQPQADLEAAVVEVKGDRNVPARLRRRTVIVDKRTGEIVGTSG